MKTLLCKKTVVYKFLLCMLVTVGGMLAHAEVDVCWGNTYDVTDELRNDSVYSRVYVDAAAHESHHIGRPDRAYVYVPSGETKTVVIKGDGLLAVKAFPLQYANVSPMNVYAIATWAQTIYQNEYIFTESAYLYIGSDQGGAEGTTVAYSIQFKQDSNPLGDLRGYVPSGWGGSLVASKTASSFSNSSQFTTRDGVYVSFAIENGGTAAIDDPFYVVLNVDGAFRNRWAVSGLAKKATKTFTNYFLGTLSAGQHEICVEIDPDGAIAEKDRTNNVLAKPFAVEAYDDEAPVLQGACSAVVDCDSVTISWLAATDRTGVSGYEFRYGTVDPPDSVASRVVSLETSVKGLPDGVYYYQIRAYDANGNYSQWSAVQSFDIHVGQVFESADTSHDLICTSGNLAFNTDGNSPTAMLDGTVVCRGRVKDGVACYDFNYVDVGQSVNVTITGARPLSINSRTDMNMAAALDVSGVKSPRAGGGMGGHGGAGGAGGSGGSTATGGSGGYGGSGSLYSSSSGGKGSDGSTGKNGTAGGIGDTGETGGPGGNSAVAVSAQPANTAGTYSAGGVAGSGGSGGSGGAQAASGGRPGNNGGVGYSGGSGRAGANGQTGLTGRDGLNASEGRDASALRLAAGGGGKDYNHSTFCDLVISGLVGFVPKGKAGFVVEPLIPPDWDWFVLEDLRYRGHDIAIRWQRGASGLTVWVDGRVAAQSEGLRAEVQWK